ncbi:MAG: type II secretion system minor pseudopilin GspJ [Proteobacteria bacterium]|nr:type II secretion system minor pseudopilin GspJ [Pseudomonadota bacterium]HQR02576.1 type II secretion system minor pseudopilin GspJ [Rhodocyclaceae bacterium]
MRHHLRVTPHSAGENGLTLLELLVALAIVALLGSLSYRALTAALDSRQHLQATLLRWQNISRAVGRIETDLLQMAPAPQSTGGLLLQTQDLRTGDNAISFVKLDGTQASVRRWGFRFTDHHLLLQRWPDTGTNAPPREDVLLDGVRALHFELLTANGKRTDEWQPGQAATLPAAVEFFLDLEDAGPLHRLVALH